MKPRGVRLVAKRWEQIVPVTLVVAVQGTAAELAKANTLPFLPRADDELGVGFDGDYMTVDTVYWCAEDGITVWFKDQADPKLKQRLLDDGWKER